MEILSCPARLCPAEGSSHAVQRTVRCGLTFVVTLWAGLRRTVGSPFARVLHLCYRCIAYQPTFGDAVPPISYITAVCIANKPFHLQQLKLPFRRTFILLPLLILLCVIRYILKYNLVRVLPCIRMSFHSVFVINLLNLHGGGLGQRETCRREART